MAEPIQFNSELNTNITEVQKDPISDHSRDQQQHHATSKALKNTKLAVAQLTANALTNGVDEGGFKDLSMFQSTLFTLQHQQMFQLKLIEQLQSQLKSNRPKTVIQSTGTKTKVNDEPGPSSPANDRTAMIKISADDDEEEATMR